MENNEFYIGWQEKAPKEFSGFLKKYLLLLSAIVICIAALLAFFQKKFDKGNFEFGTLTAITGIYYDKPIPNISVVNGRDIWGNAIISTIPLIGYGKHGVDGYLDEFQKNKNISLNGKQLIIKGTLLYNDGKLLMQVDKNDNPILNIASDSLHVLSTQQDLGINTVKGEIIDPKCFFGVMKPGEGKAHKDCAIRCILGGMPPMLLLRNGKQEANYYIIVGPNGEKVNDAVKDFVATPVELHGKLVQYNDWVVVFLDKSDGIKRYSYLQEHFSNQIADCSTACTK